MYLASLRLVFSPVKGNNNKTFCTIYKNKWLFHFQWKLRNSDQPSQVNNYNIVGERGCKIFFLRVWESTGQWRKMETKSQRRKEHTGGSCCFWRGCWGARSAAWRRRCWEIRAVSWDSDRQLLGNNGEAEVGSPSRDWGPAHLNPKGRKRRKGAHREDPQRSSNNRVKFKHINNYIKCKWTECSN